MKLDSKVKFPVYDMLFDVENEMKRIDKYDRFDEARESNLGVNHAEAHAPNYERSLQLDQQAN